MIRHEQLQHYIKTVSSALAGPIMTDLKTDSVRELSQTLMLILNHIATDLEDGDRVAASVQSEWSKLSKAATSLLDIQISDQVEQPIDGWQDLDDQLASLQSEINADNKLIEKLRDGDRDAQAWMTDMSAMLLTLSTDFDNSYQTMKLRTVAASIDRSDEIKSRLANYLKQKYPSLPDQPIEVLAIVSGGRSKLSALLTLAENDVLPRELALRMDIPNTTTPFKLDTEYPILQQVFKLGLPVPEPLLFEPDASHFGGVFVLSTQITDAKIGGSPFVEDRLQYGANTSADFGRQTAKLLALLHSKTAEVNIDIEVKQQREALVSSLAEEWSTNKKSPFSCARDLSIAWLQAHPLQENRPVCLVHGDFAQHNILTRDGDIAALLDWELSKRGDPAEDLAQCKMMVMGDGIEWDEFVQVYLANGGLASACEPHAVSYYSMLLYLQHGVYQNRQWGNFIANDEADFEGAIISSHIQARLNLYQAKALHDAVALFS